MRKTPLILAFLAFFIIPNMVSSAFAQEVIPVNQTTPCFLNDTAGVDIFRNCGMGDDYLAAIIMPWNWITGGFFSPLLVGVFILMTYIKYHKAVYPLAIGVAFLPVAYFWFPEPFVNWAMVFAALAMIGLLYYILVRQTKEYSG